MFVKKDFLENNALADEKRRFRDKTGIELDSVLDSQNINAEQNEYGRTTLYLAVRHQCPKIVEVLLGYKAIKVNLAEKRLGDTPLHAAARYGYTEVAKFLIEAEDLDVNVQNNNGETALYLAVLYEQTKFVRLLLGHKAINVNLAKQRSNFTPLHFATYYGYTEAVECLVEAENLEINAQSSDGETALYLAANRQYPKIVELLLRHEGVKVNLAKKWSGDTPLHAAADNGCAESVKYLVEAEDLDINAQNDNGETPLYLAANKAGRPEIVEVLLGHEAIKVNLAENRLGDTPLHIAVYRKDVEVIEHLVKRDDLDIYKLNNGGETAFQGTGYLPFRSSLLECSKISISLVYSIASRMAEGAIIEQDKSYAMAKRKNLDNSVERLCKLLASNPKRFVGQELNKISAPFQIIPSPITNMIREFAKF